MADKLYFSRDSKLYVELTANNGAFQGLWEVPVLDGFSFSQSTNQTEIGLNEMESEPAYKRRNVDLKDVKYSDDSSSSRYTLWENINDSGEKETGLSDNNSFLHDNVD